MVKFRVAFLGRGKLGIDVLNAMLSNDKLDVKVIVSCDTSPEVLFDKKDFENIAKKNNIEFYSTNTLNTQKFKTILSQYKLDLCVAMLWLNTIDAEIISTSRLGFVNLHGGMLPKYRGNACQTWAILNDESFIGITCHLMAKGELDSGPIIKQIQVPINSDTTVGELISKIDALGTKLVTDSIDEILSGNANLTTQISENASFCYPRLPRDGEIDWSKNGAEILKLVRAAGRPYPGAYSWFSDFKDNNLTKKLIIWDGHIEEHHLSNFHAVPGHVLKLNKGKKWAVVCGDLKLFVLKEVNLNEKTVSPEKLFNTVRQRLGLDCESKIAELEQKIEKLEQLLREFQLK